MRRFTIVVVPAMVIALLAGLLFVSSSARAQQSPPPQAPPAPTRGQECQSVLPSQTLDPILGRYRDRLDTARENMIKEERALRDLLVADATTRAALDAQSARANEARNAAARVRLDVLWEVRSAVPAQSREQAMRCAQRAMFRRR